MRTWTTAAILTVLSACAASGPSPQGPVSRQPEPESTPEVATPPASAAPTPAQAPPADTNARKALGPEIAAKLSKIRFDPAPPATTRGRHYFTSNEHSPELFRQPVSGLGGIVTGVGAEQMYLLGGWARAEVLVLTDFDDWNRGSTRSVRNAVLDPRQHRRLRGSLGIPRAEERETRPRGAIPRRMRTDGASGGRSARLGRK